RLRRLLPVGVWRCTGNRARSCHAMGDAALADAAGKALGLGDAAADLGNLRPRFSRVLGPVQYPSPGSFQSVRGEPAVLRGRPGSRRCRMVETLVERLRDCGGAGIAGRAVLDARL